MLFISDQKQEAILSWISPLDFNQVYDAALNSRVEGTGERSMESFRDWLCGNNKVLWCVGIRESLILRD